MQKNLDPCRTSAGICFLPCCAVPSSLPTIPSSLDETINWVLTDFLWRGNTRTWKSMYLLQPDRTLHHTVSRDDGLVKTRTAPSFCGQNILLLLLLKYTVLKGVVRFLTIWDDGVLGWVPAQKSKVEAPPLIHRKLILWLIALNLLW